MNNESDKKTDIHVCASSNTAITSNTSVLGAGTSKQNATKIKNCNSVSCGGVGQVNISNSNSSSNSVGSTGGSNANGKNMSTAARSNTMPPISTASSTTNSNNVKSSSSKAAASANIVSLHQEQLQLVAAAAAAAAGNSQSSSSTSSAIVNSLQNQTALQHLVNSCKLTSTASSPTRSDTDTFSELQPRVTDLSESDEESVSEILLACLCLRPDLLDEIPDSGSESCGNDVECNDEEDDGDDEDEDEDDEIRDPNDIGGNFLLDPTTDQSRKLTALFEAAANEKAPVLRHATLAIDEATQALNKMRCANSPRDKTIFSRTLIAACTDNDVNTVRRLLGKGNISINESTDDGESLLSMACSAGYYELAQVLLAMSAAQVEDKGQKDCTPLMEAASAGHLDIIKLLLSHNADVNAQCTTGNTPLMFACAGGHVEVVKELLKHGANVEDQNENGHTPLMEAASAGHVEVAKVLLEHGAGINTHSNEFKESALTLACYKGHLNMVRFLLQAGADQEHKTDEMHTALMEASMDGHVEVARLLLDSGAQVNMPTDSFESPLTLAACGGHVELATLLIERGANIEEVNDEGYTPLMEAAREGHEDMVALLLSKGANINATTEETQETALTLACCGGFMEVAEFLIKQGADLELGASTPLMEAAQEGHTDLVRFLLENGANVHAQTQTGDTALTHACENGHTDAAEVLLYYGAELEHESEGGRTPLMKACRAGHICTVKFLISKGADVNKQTTSNDHTALSLACAGGHQAVVELLLKSGADPFHKLKDNSTMLIEASKGGHIRVVETLFKYPNFVGNQNNENNTSITNSNNNNGQIQMQPINIQQQKQLQQLQQMTAPPGLHEVPEAVRVSNQQLFHQQQFQSLEYLDEQVIASATETLAGIDPNARNLQQQEALIAKMRLFQLQAGFEDGLAHGLARAQPNVVNQIISQSNSCSNQSNANIQTNLSSTHSANSTVQTTGASNKTKSLLRKNRQPPAPFELNLTSSEAQQVRSQPLGEDDNSVYVTTNMTSSEDEQQQQRRKIFEELQKKVNIYCDAANIVCDASNGTPTMPYVDITTASTQGLMYSADGMNFAASNGTAMMGPVSTGAPTMQSASLTTFISGAKAADSNNSFLLTTTSLPTLQTAATPSAVVASSSSGNQQLFSTIQASTSAVGTNTSLTTSSPSLSTASTTTTKITTPSEVSQSTAISDRPKVKPVSKKDAKSLRKATTVLQPMVSIYNSLPLLLPTEPSYQSHQQTLGGISMAGQQLQMESHSLQQALQQLPSNAARGSAIFQQTASEITESSSSTSSTSSSDSISSSAASTDHDEQLSKLTLNNPMNRKMLQMVAHNPTHPNQKNLQRLTIDQPKSPTETPPASESDRGPDSPTKADADFVDISRALREAVHDFRPELNPTEIVQVLQPISNLIPHKASSVNGQQQFTIQSGKSQHTTSGTFGGQHEDHFRMYPVDNADEESIGDCGIYPALGESLDTFTTEDDGTRDQICSYELGLGDCMEEFFNVFQGVNDPAFQELTTNLNCSEFAEFGINSFCKSRWAGQWVPPQQTQDLLNHQTGNTTQNVCIGDDQADLRQQANQLLIDHQLQQQLTHRLTVEEMQIYNQLQFSTQHQQTTLSLIPISAEEQQQTEQNHQTNIGIQALPNQTGIQSQQQQTQTNSTENQTSNISPSLLQSTSTGIQQSQLLQQQQQMLSGDTQNQAKFVFNVDSSDKPSQSLQLLFQLPPVQQGQQQHPAAIITTQQQQQQSQQISNQAIAQTQTAVCQPVQTQITQTNLNLQQHTILAQSQPQQPCVQHSQQVQVATQTQQQPTSSGGIISSVSTGSQFCSSVPTSGDGGTVTTQQQTGTTKTSATAKKSIDKASRKERNRYTVMRQTPAGSQANTTAQQPSTQGNATSADKTIDVDSETDSNHDTALTLACAGGHEELVELLINRGANIEHRDKKGFTPLILAATAGHEKVVSILLKHGAELEAQSERTKDTPLSLACSGGRYEVVELLLSVGANKEHRNVSDYTPLSLAASGGYVNIIKLLLSHGAEINSRTGSKLGISPLMLAAMNGHTAAVKLLLDMGSDINAQIETNRNTALTLACFQGRHEVVSLLLDRKANVEHRAKTGLTPLMEAASGGYIEVGRVLLDKGADVNAAPVPTSRDTALTIAADKGHLKFVELLLSRGAAVEVKNKKGNSPLWLAAHGGHLAVVEVLYAHGADIDSQDNRRVSCLMAAFRKGHTKVVKWMVQHVTQFPSDQEMTRFISTISDKELLEKCYDCVKIIRAAKEAQAVKANKNASILLEELDMERTREESRRAAAARRREKKKKKKLEKKEEKRKLLEGMNNSEQNAEKESEKEDDSDKEEEVIEGNRNQDREEGDSGIDQGSCSSTDMKAANVQPEKNNKTKNKKKKNNNNNVNKQTNNENSNRGSNSPLPERAPSEPERVAPAAQTKKKEDVSNKNKKETAINKPEIKKQVEKHEHVNKKDETKKKEVPGKDNLSKNKEKEKENLAPKEDNSKQIKHPEKKPEPIPPQAQKQHLSSEIVAPPNPTSTGNRKSMIFSARYSTIDKEDMMPSKPHRHHEDIKITPSKPLPVGAKRGEDGWKEVVRKSSIQQQTTASSSTISEMTCKKVQVPVHAISRVIGRAGSNINAIRATTGAHIEVEKQGKSQSDRWITIKGLPDATKQAHLLISALIKDPDVDILQMLPRVNPSSKPPPLVVNSWDKNTPFTHSAPIPSSIVCTIVTTTGPSKAGKPVQTSANISLTKTTLSSVGSNKSTGSSVRVSTKQGFMPSAHARSVVPTSICSSSGRTTTEYNNGQKRGPLGINGNQSSDSLSSGTKTTTAYPNAIMSLKNAPPKSSTGLNTQHLPQGMVSFAAKLHSGSDKKTSGSSNQVLSQAPIQNQISSTFHSSPKKSSNLYEVNNMLYGPTRKITGNNFSANNTSMPNGLSTSFTNSSEVTTSTPSSAGRSITPIGPPSTSNRNITSSPLLQASTQNIASDTITTTSTTCPTSSAMAIQPQGLASQLQTNKISHEYSLFNTCNSQWESKQIYNTSSSDTLPKADASKAPGYNRGNVMSSPVSSKTSSNSTTPPGSSVQAPGQAQNLNVMPTSVSATSPATSHSSVGSQNVIPPPAPEVFTSSTGEITGVLKPVSQNMPSGPPPPASGLAIQRPNAQNRPSTSQIDNNYGPIGSNTNRDQTQNATRGYFEQMTNQNINQQHNINYPDPLQQQYHQHISSVNHANPLQMSRLNPRASVFSQQSKSSQQLGGMFHQTSSNVGLNSYQKMPVGSQNVVGGGNSIPQYNPAPGRPQSQPQAGSNARWFGSTEYGYMPSTREILNLENGLAMGPGSPAMSPNNAQPQANGIISQQTNQQQQPIAEDNRKMPRPIGTERASWKYNNYPNINAAVEPDPNNTPAGPMPPWMMEKAQAQQQQQQQPIQQNWNKTHPRYYGGDMHPQDHFHIPIDYHSAILPPTVNPAAMNLMPTFQYPHFVGHADMTQIPDKIEPWEHDKQHGGWSSNWTN